VSHWGNIAILEEYALHNQGANLTGEFGRVVFNKYNTNAGKNALKELIATLPFSTWGIYYRDEIGNISTSNAKRDVFMAINMLDN
jgi:oligosaccharyltransferase complex subunit alpha (ribophorin I)